MPEYRYEQRREEPPHPALTAGEWVEARAPIHDRYCEEAEVAEGSEGKLHIGCGHIGVTVQQADRAKLAALALHGQPFGFTQADVERLMGLARWLQDRAPEDLWFVGSGDIRDLANRIAALLPPGES